MLNYLKWELKNYFKNKYKLGIVIGIVYFLMLIVGDFESSQKGPIISLIVISYVLILSFCIFGAYLAGTRYAVNTFSRKTFLLESMIPVSVKKILLCKYLLGIIINFAYILCIIVGISVILLKGEGIETTFETYKLFFSNLNFEMVLTLTTTSVFLLASVVFAFVLTKVISPNNKHNNIFGFILSFLFLYFTSYILNSIFSNVSNIYLINFIYIIISVGLFYITAYFIENKLEIYD